jgi:UDP-N-acetylmuramate dehydrogenase
MSEALPGQVRLDEPMSRHTTYRIGGPADMFVVADTLAGLTRAVEILAEEDVEYTVVGKGSNLLVADAGYRGAVVVLGREFRRHSFDGVWLQAGAGSVLAVLVQDAYRRGLAGLVFAVGIPGTFGGAAAMNAGSKDAWIGELVDSVTLFVAGEGLVRVRGTQVAWAYRSSGLARRGIIVEGVLKLVEGDADVIRRDMERIFTTRKRSQPLAVPSAGSVFMNPEGDSAGRLIEAAGLKGTRLGGARVSKVHANFIVNDGGATASDVVGLIRKVQMTVRDTNGIELRPEVRFLGEFDTA